MEKEVRSLGFRTTHCPFQLRQTNQNKKEP